MFLDKKLEGRRVALLAADGFEKVELTVPLAALRAQGADVHVISLRRGRIRGMNVHEPAGRVKVDLKLDQADPDDYDALMIPGGLINPDLLRQSERARAFVQAFDSANKPIAALCHAPWVLASAGLAQGRTLTSWPSVRDDLVHAGATWLDQPLVRDGNWVTSRGPQDLPQFVKGMIDLFASEAPEPRVASTRASDPPHDQPPKAMIRAMKWLPRPSLRGALTTLALVAGALFAARRMGVSVNAPPRRIRAEPRPAAAEPIDEVVIVRTEHDAGL